MSTEKIPRVHVGKNIRYIRKLKKKTQKELADALDITQSAVSQFERSADGLHEKTIKKISDELEVEPLFFYFGEVSDESDFMHDILIDVILNYPPEEQYDKYREALDVDIERRQQLISVVAEGDSMAVELLGIFDTLNSKGRKEAMKRVEELAQLDQYKKED